MSGRRAFVHRHVVTFDETNLLGNVYFTHYLHWQGHCREMFLAEHVPGALAALQNGLVLVTVSCSVQYFAECHALDELEIRMTLKGVAGNRIELHFDYHVVRGAQPGLVARGEQGVATMQRGYGGLEPVPPPVELTAALEPFT